MPSRRHSERSLVEKNIRITDLNTLSGVFRVRPVKARDTPLARGKVNPFGVSLLLVFEECVFTVCCRELLGVDDDGEACALGVLIAF